MATAFISESFYFRLLAKDVRWYKVAAWRDA